MGRLCYFYARPEGDFPVSDFTDLRTSITTGYNHKISMNISLKLATDPETGHYYGVGWSLLRKIPMGDFAVSLMCQTWGLTSLRVCTNFREIFILILWLYPVVMEVLRSVKLETGKSPEWPSVKTSQSELFSCEAWGRFSSLRFHRPEDLHYYWVQP